MKKDLKMFIKVFKIEDFKHIADETNFEKFFIKDNGTHISFNDYSTIDDNSFYEVEKQLDNGDYKLLNKDFIVPEAAVEKISFL
jgi:hypothetical protein